MVASPLLVLAILATIALLLVQMFYWTSLIDKELLNGEVVSKSKEQVSCSHSYMCNCTTSNNVTSCQTCYEHSWDYDWVVKSNVGSVEIDRVNRQGTIEPPRFTQVMISEPFTIEHSFKNYIKANNASLFNQLETVPMVEQFKKKLPAYPITVYDYYRADRVINVGTSIKPTELKLWNQKVSETLKVLGPRKHVNLVIVLVNEKDSMYAQALQAHWLGGKKNDVILVVGSTAYPAVDWVEVLSWSDEELLKIQLRDAIKDIPHLSADVTVKTAADHINRLFVRKQMKDFEYLDDVSLSTIALAVLVLALWIAVWWQHVVRKVHRF